ncbi:hypothetical protein [Dysgonomonas sp. 25]|uniref:hypothetical protein n=1 Tax=Dysgonomonas sp. 25 TaxID=2302933 RepID=UPI0013D4A8B2|nr:hypothetical protein [Dysgonomonas sp. 25]NDV70037.1 hypothetical protein [Dysgonomonas sp. 25]
MISEFKLITEEGDNAYMETNLDKYGSRENIRALYTREQSEDEVYRVLGNQHTGLAWQYQGEEIILLNNTFSRVDGFPSLDMQYVVALFNGNKKYPKPTNLVVYNGDGSIHLDNIAPPVLLNYPKGSLADFLQIFWKFDKEDNKWKNAIRIAVNRMWMETREFNPETGEFGKALKDSTRL